VHVSGLEDIIPACACERLYNGGVVPTVRVISHGCKSNQYDGDVIVRQLAGLGCQVVHSGPADAYVVNTCAVTTTAQAKGRKLIRRLGRSAPGKVIATGCAVHAERDSLERIPGIGAVMGNDEKHAVAQATARLVGVSGTAGMPVLAVRDARGRTRAVVKVQDGCDMSCSYCFIRLARGPARSRPMPEVTREVQWLAQEGVKEVVLTGIRLGAYHGGDGDLAGLLCALSDAGVPRIRLSSLDIWDLTPGLLEAMATNRRVCPHLHLPLQSGDAGILSAMRRPYTPDVFVEKVGQARQAIPDLAITSDVMVGFPGESHEAFENTVRLVENLQLDGLHVFRFSPRPGTPAAKMPGQMQESTKKERCDRLLAVARCLSARFAQRFVGKRVEVLFETHDPATGLCEGFSQHYLRVSAPASPDLRNHIASVAVSEARCDLALGTLAQNASA